MVILHGGISSLKSDETQINNQARLPWVTKLRCESRSIIVVCAVVIGCHSNISVMTRFLFRAQDLNMTNHHAMTKDRTTLDHNPTNHYAMTKDSTTFDHNPTNHHAMTKDHTTLDLNMTNHHAMTKDHTTLDHNMTNHHAVTKDRTSFDHNPTNHPAVTKDRTTLDHNMTNHHAITKYRTNLDHNMTNHHTVTNDLTTLDHNMTNGDFAFFTFQIVRQVVTYTPWEFAVADPAELPRRQLAYRAVKQVASLAAGFS